MAMEDTQNLAAAIVANRWIQQGSLRARVLFATIHCDHRTGEFSGSVNFHVEGEKSVRIEAFYKMWAAGWMPEPEET